jgi:ATP-binding cassette subfamily B protein
MDTTKQTLKLFWNHASRYPLQLYGIFISVPLTVLVGSFLSPLIVAHILSRLSTHSFTPHQVWSSFGNDIIAYTVLQLVSGVIGWRIIDNFAWKLEGKVSHDMAERVFAHLLSQSPNFHANRFSGSLVSQTNKLLGGYLRFADTTWFMVLPLLSSLLFAGIILATRSPLYALILIMFAVIYMTSAIFVTAPTRKRSAMLAAAESRQTGNLADAVSNVMAIKSFAGFDHEVQRFAKSTKESHEKLLDMMRAHRSQQLYFATMSNGLMGVSLAMAVVSAMLFNANIATVFLIVNFTSTVASNLFQFSNTVLRNYNRALGDTADMTMILQLEPEIKDPIKPLPVHIKKGEIHFDNVTFTHDGSDSPLFTGLNLVIKPGEKIGLVGHSGSGKTTFTRLLLRFSDIQGGVISIDGQDISKLRQDDLHHHIAYVPQEPILFHRTLLENIRYGSLGASKQAIEAIAQLAHAHEFISVLPDGYDTLVGERGVKLSGGQRQRIAIARAMLKNAPILVLDEATAALDSESEALIQDALWKLMEDRTAIVVAHRLSTIQKMNRIVVMDDGKIIEQGTHNELLKQAGTYASLWRRQSGGFIE